MAGFTDTNIMGDDSRRRHRQSKLAKRLSRYGVHIDSMVMKNADAIGIAGTSVDQINQIDQTSMWNLFTGFSINESFQKSISFFELDYPIKRAQLKQIAMQDEIANILDIIQDEAIVNDTNRYFAHLKISGDMSENIVSEANYYYKNIYNWFGFDNGQAGSAYFRRLLVEGYIAFEIIYNDDATEIIGFQELDSATLVPTFDTSTGQTVWIQYPNDPSNQRVLQDKQVIYISYSSANSSERTSYVERLIRSYNTLRIMETTRIVWAVTNASFKTQFIIPVGDVTPTMGEQTLRQICNKYREIVDFNWDTGEIMSNGRPMIPFNKEYWFPSKQGETPQVQTIGGDGPQLNDTETLSYFSDKLKLASKIPFSRFDKMSGSMFGVGAEGQLRDEINFAKFIDRLQSIYQEILIKPLYIQMCLKHPELSTDRSFQSRLGLSFNKDNLFEMMKTIEVMQKKTDYIGNLLQSFMSPQDKDGNQSPLLSFRFLCEKFELFTKEEMELNKKYLMIDKYVGKGYKEEDAEKIASGEDEKNFKPENGGDEEGNGGDEGGGEGGGGGMTPAGPGL